MSKENIRMTKGVKPFWLAALLGAALSSQAQDILPENVATALRTAQLNPVSLSALVLPLAGGAARLAHLDARPMAPASTLKLVTTLVTLEELGPTFRWRTQLLGSGSLRADTWRGTLFLRGGGEPNLTWDGMRNLLRSLRAQGIRQLDGDLVLDRSFFQPTRPDLGAPVFDESPNAYYNVIPDALLLGGNMIEFSISSDAQHSTVQTQPSLARLRIDANLTLNDSACEAWDDDWDAPRTELASNGRVTVKLRGAFPRNCSTKTRLSVLDRNLYIERFVRAFWRELGGNWRGRVRDGLTPPEARLLAEHNSETLADLVRPVNKASDNAMARTLYLTLGTQLPATARSDNTLVNAQAAMQAWFARNGIATEGLVFENGSGLSRLERITAQQMASLLQLGARSNWYAEFASSLPIVAIDGAMRKRLRDSPAAARARIKTGSLRDVAAIAGYVRDVKNQDWVVVAMINDADARKGRPALDALVHWVAGGN